MTHRQTNTARIAAAKSGFSGSSAYRHEKDASRPSEHKPARERRRPDPLLAIWDSEIVPMLKAAPGLREAKTVASLSRFWPVAYTKRPCLQRRN